MEEYVIIAKDETYEGGPGYNGIAWKFAGYSEPVFGPMSRATAQMYIRDLKQHRATGFKVAKFRESNLQSSDR